MLREFSVMDVTQPLFVEGKGVLSVGRTLPRGRWSGAG